MDFSDKLILKFNKNSNYTLAFICRIAAILMLIAIILTACNVFVLGNEIYPVLSASILIMLLPTLFYNVLHKDSTFLKYLFLTILVLMAGLLYSLLSYHVILMLAFPVLVSCLYCEKKCVVYTSVLSYPVIIASHFIAFALKMVPDEPLVTLRGVIAYGILPRLLEFTIMFVIAYSMTDKVERLIKDLISKNKESFDNQQTVIYSLSEMIETQSHDTGAHVKRVSEYTKILCRAMNMSDEETWLVSTAAMMHDVGKLMVPANILNKPGKLTNEEFSEVKKHVEFGENMLKNAPGELMKISTEIAKEHHEKYNGEGYLKMKGEEISIYARIVAIADVFDALISRRPYKEAWDLSAAKQEILSQSGKHFDPELVKLFDENFDKFVEVHDSYPDENN
ncbi:MAG: HD-GYP domain-containing protein [Candidatus Coproplasma sp.]